MFKRVLIEDWAHIIPVISFFIFFCVFIVVTLRAMRMQKTDRERLATLPLDPTPENHPSQDLP
jgi:cbb3-type cytochrome oxidase subunit 3